MTQRPLTKIKRDLANTLGLLETARKLGDPAIVERFGRDVAALERELELRKTGLVFTYERSKS